MLLKSTRRVAGRIRVDSLNVAASDLGESPAPAVTKPKPTPSSNYPNILLGGVYMFLLNRAFLDELFPMLSIMVKKIVGGVIITVRVALSRGGRFRDPNSRLSGSSVLGFCCSAAGAGQLIIRASAHAKQGARRKPLLGYS